MRNASIAWRPFPHHACLEFLEQTVRLGTTVCQGSEYMFIRIRSALVSFTPVFGQGQGCHFAAVRSRLRGTRNHRVGRCDMGQRMRISRVVGASETSSSCNKIVAENPCATGASPVTGYTHVKQPTELLNKRSFQSEADIAGHQTGFLP